MKIGILILYFNTPHLVDELTKTIPEAIIIDNGSDKDKRYNGKNRCIYSSEPLGFTKGWNFAVSKLWDEFDAFWLMNSDISISRKSVDIAINSFSEGLDIYTPSYNCWIKDCQNKKTTRVRNVGVIEFTAPIISKQVFEKTGMLDEIYARGYGVEFDFCYRARKNGFKIWVDDNSSFVHKGQGTISKHEGIIEYSAKANIELNQGMIKKYGSDWRNIVFENISIKSDFGVKICVYTTIFGNYASLKPVPKQTVNVDFYCITDNPSLKCQGWKIICPPFPRKDMHPRLRAKYFKLLPWELPEIEGNEISIYIDGSIRIKSNTFIEYCLKYLEDDFLLFRHPDRDCIYDEIKASLPLEKYRNESIKEQGEFYSKFHPKKWGLWACGVMVRKHTERVKKLMAHWKHEIDKWTWQDQISFPVVCKLMDFKPSVFPDNQYNNDYIEVIWHDDNKPEPVQEISVTVLMPVWKTDKNLLSKAIQSILLQTYKKFEFLIIDDGNEDPNLFAYLFDLTQKDSRIRMLSKKHVSLSDALNFGLKNASGELIIRMDSDDEAMPDLIEKQVEFFSKYPGASICGVQINIFKDGNYTGKSNHPFMVDRNVAKRNLHMWFVNHPGIAYKKNIAVKLGGYPETNNQKAEDYPLWIKFLINGHTIYNLDKSLIKYNVFSNSYSQSNANKPGNIRWLKEWRMKL